MANVTEYGCEKCGSRIVKPAIAPIIQGAPPPAPGTRCDDCGYISEALRMPGFQCAPRVLSSIRHLCSDAELKQLRLAPQSFIATINSRLTTKGKAPLQVDSATRPPTIGEA